MEWIDIETQLPDISDEEELFLVSNGENISLATWINLNFTYPDKGYDWDEHEFNNFPYPWTDVKYWMGPLTDQRKSLVIGLNGK